MRKRGPEPVRVVHVAVAGIVAPSRVGGLVPAILGMLLSVLAILGGDLHIRQ